MIYIIDNGGQYTHVIWRQVRELGKDAKVVPNTILFGKIADAESVILSGGPGSAYSDDFGTCREIIQKIDNQEFQAPLLGICMGHQLIAHFLGGTVARGDSAEYGTMEILVDDHSSLFREVPEKFNAWVSHFDEVKEIPSGFKGLAHSDVCKYEAMEQPEKKIFGVQFHPEVWHTENGEKILENFLKQ